MDIRVGDRVFVNVAAFTGSTVPRSESICCRAVVVGEEQVEVQTEPPYRIFNALVARSWIERIDGPHRVAC